MYFFCIQFAKFPIQTNIAGVRRSPWALAILACTCMFWFVGSLECDVLSKWSSYLVHGLWHRCGRLFSQLLYYMKVTETCGTGHQIPILDGLLWFLGRRGRVKDGPAPNRTVGAAGCGDLSRPKAPFENGRRVSCVLFGFLHPRGPQSFVIVNGSDFNPTDHLGMFRFTGVTYQPQGEVHPSAKFVRYVIIGAFSLNKMPGAPLRCGLRPTWRRPVAAARLSLRQRLRRLRPRHRCTPPSRPCMTVRKVELTSIVVRWSPRGKKDHRRFEHVIIWNIYCECS